MDDKEYKKRLLQQRELLMEKLRYVAALTHMRRKVYKYYLQLLNLEINAWNQEQNDERALLDRALSDIVAFNLEYYMVAALERNCGKDMFYHQDLKYCSKGTEILSKSFHSTAFIRWYSNGKNDCDPCSNWLIELTSHIYDENFNQKKLNAMKLLFDEMEKRSNVSELDKRFLYSSIYSLDNCDDVDREYEMKTTNSSYEKDKIEKREFMLQSEKIILDALIKEYGIIIPSEDDSVVFENDFSSRSDGHLTSLSHWYRDSVLSIEKDALENNHGTIRVNKRYYDKRLIN